MPETVPNLGKLVGRYAISPVFVQRATFIAVLAFMFFLAMMFAYYIFHGPVYFLLASAFLLVYIVTMFGLLAQKRNVLEIFEHGVSYRKFSSRWEDLEAVEQTKPNTYQMRKHNGETAILSNSLDRVEEAANRIEALAKAHSRPK